MPLVGRRRLCHARFGALVAITTFLALTATASYAVFSGTASFVASVTSASTAFTSSGLSSLSTAYTATSTTKIVPVTLTNSGSAPLVLSSVTVSSSGSAALAAATSLRLWLATSCGTTIPTTAFATTLAAATSTIASSFALSMPAGSAVALCAATSLTGSPGALAGLNSSFSVTLTASTPGSSLWTTTDAAASAARTFTQSVIGYAPTAVTCSPGDGYNFFFVFPSVNIGWTAPVGATVTGYNIYVDGVLTATTTGTSIELDSSLIRAVGTQTVAVKSVVGGVEYLSATTVAIDSVAFFFIREVTCA